MKTPVFLAAAVVLLMSGCATVSEIPDELRYSRKAEDITNPAFIHGSNHKDAFPLFDDHTACVMAIDGRTIKDERKRWNQDIPLEPGDRKIDVVYYHGMFITMATFDLEIKPGAKYEIRFKEEGNQQVDFWLVDLAVGTPVTGVSRGLITGGSSGGFVPIFIPMK